MFEIVSLMVLSESISNGCVVVCLYRRRRRRSHQNKYFVRKISLLSLHKRPNVGLQAGEGEKKNAKSFKKERFLVEKKERKKERYEKKEQN